MRYVGGKSKLAKAISNKILEMTTDRGVYLEPFIGGGSVFAKMAPHFQRAIGADLSEDIVALWQGVTREGFIPPEVVTEEEYQSLKTAPPSALRGFVGFGGSFGGKWFGGYARGGFQASGEPRNHQAESSRAILKIATEMAKTETFFKHASYQRWRPQAGNVVYCDPPYAETQGYSVGGFDSLEFWRTMDEWVENGATVFVSEYEAPPHWTAVWEQQHRQSLVRPEQGRHLTLEKLFTRTEQKDA